MCPIRQFCASNEKVPRFKCSISTFHICACWRVFALVFRAVASVLAHNFCSSRTYLGPDSPNASKTCSRSKKEDKPRKGTNSKNQPIDRGGRNFRYVGRSRLFSFSTAKVLSDLLSCVLGRNAHVGEVGPQMLRPPATPKKRLNWERRI